MNPSLDRLARDIGREIEYQLDGIGILYRIFVRAKSEDSIKRKLDFKQYASGSGKLMQDIIGVRITFYFNDDLDIVYKALKSRSNFVDETVDSTTETVFRPERVNLIFRLDYEKSAEVNDIAVSKFKYIDSTFEIQLRTVLSEGWHEVDHDLRYKCSSDWLDSSDIARTFNGVYASLATSDWSILTIFEKLAYRQYKSQNWAAMLRHKFRLRFREEDLSEKIIEILNGNHVLAKQFFRIERKDFIKNLFNDKVRVPMTLTNLIFLVNIYFVKNKEIIELTPEPLTTNNKLKKYFIS
jgi:putative GTP pyrophosphokinase